MSKLLKLRTIELILFCLMLSGWVTGHQSLARAPQTTFAVGGTVTDGLLPPEVAPLTDIVFTFTRVAGTGALPAGGKLLASPCFRSCAWQQTGLETGTTYRVTPSLRDHKFEPAFYEFSGAQVNLNFTVTRAPFALAGRIVDANGQGLAGVSLQFGSGTAISVDAPPNVQSDVNGNWRQDNFPPIFRCGTFSIYRVRPILPGWRFTPESTARCREDIAVNFVAQQLGVPSVITKPVSAANYASEMLGRQSIVTLFGETLAEETASATTQPLPLNLGKRVIVLRSLHPSVTTDSAPQQMLYVSPGQINFVLATDLTGSTLIKVLSTDTRQTVASGLVMLTDQMPGLFSADATGRGLAAAVALRVKADSTQQYESIARFDPATEKHVAVPLRVGLPDERVFLVLYGTGFGLQVPLNDVNVRLGGLATTVTYAGAASGLAGLTQINALVPPELRGRGTVDIDVSIAGKTSNRVTLTVE